MISAYTNADCDVPDSVSAVIPFPDEFRIGNVFSMIVYGLDYENLEYGYRFDGEYARA